jgi:hypothetical protein
MCPDTEADIDAADYALAVPPTTPSTSSSQDPTRPSPGQGRSTRGATEDFEVSPMCPDKSVTHVPGCTAAADPVAAARLERPDDGSDGTADVTDGRESS